MIHSLIVNSCTIDLRNKRLRSKLDKSSYCATLIAWGAVNEGIGVRRADTGNENHNVSGWGTTGSRGMVGTLTVRRRHRVCTSSLWTLVWESMSPSRCCSSIPGLPQVPSSELPGRRERPFTDNASIGVCRAVRRRGNRWFHGFPCVSKMSLRLGWKREDASGQEWTSRINLTIDFRNENDRSRTPSSG